MYRIRSAAPPKSYSDWCEHEPFRPNLDVDGAKEVDTGLLDMHGNVICRVQHPVGFGRMEEWS